MLSTEWVTEGFGLNVRWRLDSAVRAVHVRHPFAGRTHVLSSVGKTPSFSFCQVDMYAVYPEDQNTVSITNACLTQLLQTVSSLMTILTCCVMYPLMAISAASRIPYVTTPDCLRTVHKHCRVDSRAMSCKTIALHNEMCPTSTYIWRASISDRIVGLYKARRTY